MLSLWHSPLLLFLKNRKGKPPLALSEIRLGRDFADYFPKLATASASVLYTSKMVISLVICSTSWNFVPK